MVKILNVQNDVTGKLNYVWQISQTIHLFYQSENDYRLLTYMLIRGGTPLYRLHRYERCPRVWFLTPFGLKLGKDFNRLV